MTRRNFNMELEYTPKYFRNCRDSYDIHAKIKKNDDQLPFEECNKGDNEPRIKARYIAVFMCFMGEFFLFYHRITMSVTIKTMVNNSAIHTVTELSSIESCLNLVEMNRTDENFKKMEGEFQWSPEVQGYILWGSFLFYVIAMPFSSKLAGTYGGKRVLFLCVFFSSFFTFISPFATRWSVYALMLVQILRGISQSGILPTEAILIANWCPHQERGYLYTIAICGSPVGVVMGSYITGMLCESTLLGGWPSAFFVNGGVGLIMSMIILFFLYDNPSVHPKISPVELEYILNNQERALTEMRPNTPWRKMFKSVPLYALAYAEFGQFWAMSHFLSINSTFLKTILHYPVEQDDLLNALPFLLQIFTSQIGSILSTQLTKRNYISVDKSRKFWTFLGSSGYSACLLGIYFTGCNRTLTTCLSIAALSFVGFCFAGIWVVSADMSPTFAGSINAITSSIGSLSHFILPIVVGYLTNGSQTIEQWRKIFLICIGVVLSSSVLFGIFGSAEIQPWNDVSEDNRQEKKEKTEVHLNNL